jgi:hypothetical protein
MNKAVLALLLLTANAIGQIHRLPPPGIVVAPKDEHDLLAALEQLDHRIAGLQGNIAVTCRIPR